MSLPKPSSKLEWTEAAAFPATPSVSSLAALPGGGLCTGHPSGALQLWTLDGKVGATLEGHTQPVCALATGPRGELVSGSLDRTVKVWVDNSCVLTCTGHRGAILAVAVSPVDGIVASGSASKMAKVWSGATGECLATLEGHDDWVSGVCVQSDGVVVTGSIDETVRVWARGSWTCTTTHRLPSFVHSVASIRGGFAVGGGSGDGGFVSVWRDGVEVRRAATGNGVCRLSVHGDVVVACTPTTGHLFCDGGLLGEWDTARQRAVALPGGCVAVMKPEDDHTAIKILRFMRPSRLAAIHIMVSAWCAHGGAPPATEGDAGDLRRALCLRRFCRPRGETWEVVEPFARDIVGFL